MGHCRAVFLFPLVKTRNRNQISNKNELSINFLLKLIYKSLPEFPHNSKTVRSNAIVQKHSPICTSLNSSFILLYYVCLIGLFVEALFEFVISALRKIVLLFPKGLSFTKQAIPCSAERTGEVWLWRIVRAPDSSVSPQGLELEPEKLTKLHKVYKHS